jgi:hypothetical protein
LQPNTLIGVFFFRIIKCNFKSKRLSNPEQNGWKSSNTNALIFFNGRYASDNSGGDSIVFAKKGFHISGELPRKESNFPGTILYYFEVTQISEMTTSNIP